MIRLFTITLCLIAISVIAAQTVEAGGYARARGHFGESPGESGTSTDPVHAKVSTETVFSPSGDEFLAMAENVGPQLHAYGYAIFNGVEGATASATSSWTETLRVRNPELLQSVPAGISAFGYFEPTLEGYIDGSGDVLFTTTITDINGSELNDSIESSEPSYGTQSLRLKPLISTMVAGATFTMTIDITATAEVPGQQSISDFWNTAFLPPIYIGDANGNPIPQLAGLQIVDSLGQFYPVTVVQKTPGDYNGDGVVNAADYVVWRNTAGQTGLVLNADGDGSQSVGAEDYTLWRRLFGKQANFGSGAGSSNAAAVPEPTTLLLLLSVVGVVGTRLPLVTGDFGRRSGATASATRQRM